jgi:hypothetical protein
VDRERYKVFSSAPMQLIFFKKPALLPVQEHLQGTAAVSLTTGELAAALDVWIFCLKFSG